MDYKKTACASCASDYLALNTLIICAIRSAKLRDEYRSPCGICIKVCPVGKDRELFDRKNMSVYSGKKKFERYHKAWEHVRKYGSKG